MWNDFKLWFAGIRPDLMKFLKAAIKLGIDVLLPLAINAVMAAEVLGGSGDEKFKYACSYVKANAPQAAMGAIMTAVQNAWATKEADGWKTPVCPDGKCK